MVKFGGPFESVKGFKGWVYSDPQAIKMYPVADGEDLPPRRENKNHKLLGSRHFQAGPKTRMDWRIPTEGNQTRTIARQSDFRFTISKYQEPGPISTAIKYNQFRFSYTIYGLGLPLHSNRGTDMDERTGVIDIEIEFAQQLAIWDTFGYVEWGCRMNADTRSWTPQHKNWQELQPDEVFEAVVITYRPKEGKAWAVYC